ncbi:hypothetical protein [Knoellia remsis]|uniref:hypothetical protein n=1 Tax=Knoellia remsis TaxID=407159 RepID=UPI000D060D7F|nr:hypothetical protein [Knoellia remsis]
MSAPTPNPRSGQPRPASVTRLLQSDAFARSRRTAARMESDPAALGDLIALVRLRKLDTDPHLGAVADLVHRATEWLLASGPDSTVPDRMSTTLAARRRMAVAALCYLVDVGDVIPDHRTDGTLDDLVVLQSVLSRAVEVDAPPEDVV